MSTLRTVTKKCAICGSEIECKEILSTSAMGSTDLDTRPPQMKRSLLSDEIQYCPCCHYSNYNIEEKIDGLDTRLLQSASYLAVANDADIERTAKAYLLSAHLYAKSGNARMAGGCFLRAAWAFDDVQRIDLAVRARKKAIQSMVSYVEESGDVGVAVTAVDLQRRIGDFEDAIETADQLLNYGTDSELLDKILEYEKKLCAQRDDKCHKVSEAM